MDQLYKIATTTTTTLLLLLTTIVAAALVDKQGYSNPGPEPQGCSKEGPVDSGPCKGGYYPYCVTEAMKLLTAEAPTDGKEYGKSESYPAGNPSGGAYGTAVCVLGSYPAGCQSCLQGLTDMLTSYCSNSGGGYYYNQYCSMRFYQLS